MAMKYKSSRIPLSFVGYGYLDVTSDSQYVAKSVIDSDGNPLPGILDLSHENDTPDYPLSFLCPIVRDDQKNVCYVEHANGYHSAHMMVRKWEEFEEFQSKQRFEDYLRQEKGPERLQITPRFNVLGTNLLIEADGCLYCGFFHTVERGYEIDLQRFRKAKFKVPEITSSQLGLFIIGRGKEVTLENEDFYVLDFFRDKTTGKTQWGSFNEFCLDDKYWENVPDLTDSPNGLGGWVIIKRSIQEPMGSKVSVEYDGRDHKKDIPMEPESYQTKFSTSTEWTDVGKYSVTFTLTPSARQQFLVWRQHKNSDSVKCELTITKANNKWVSCPSITENEVKYGGKLTFNLGTPKFGETQVDFDEGEPEQPITPGDHKIRFYVPETKNYSPLEQIFAYTIIELPNSERLKQEEIQFLLEFKKYVEKCGFSYGDSDIARFHTSVKCGMLTLLGGKPGCGKSSLAELYGKFITPKSNFHSVTVNPSWVEPADLMGYKSILPVPSASSGESQHVFNESPSRLHEFLVSADDNHPAIVRMEEMNLARIEFYFSEFMELLGGDEKGQSISGYPGRDEEQNELKVGVNLRFIGTFNDDATVQQMSDRLLDRCNLIILEDHFEKPFSMASGKIQDVDKVGLEPSCKSYDKYAKWFRNVDELDNAEACEIIDKLNGWYSNLNGDIDGKKLFEALDIHPSFRVRACIIKYVINRPNLENLEKDMLLKKAFDEALAQRVLSKCRPNPAQRRNFEELEQRLAMMELMTSRKLASDLVNKAKLSFAFPDDEMQM